MMYAVFPRLRLRVSVFAMPALLVMLWCEGILPFLVLLLSASLHELGHVTVMTIEGYRYRRIDILPMGALIVCPEGIPDRIELKIALGGPLASLLCALICFAFLKFFSVPVLLYAALVNCVLGLFNLMPVKKLDGGKALACFLSVKYPEKEKTAELICSAASVFSIVIFIILEITAVFAAGFNLGVIILSAVLLFQLLQR